MIVFTALVVYVGYYKIWSSLAGIPGPFFASLSRAWLVFHSLSGDMHRETVRLHEKHGSLVRIGPNQVSVTDPDAIRKIYGPSYRPAIYCTVGLISL